MRTSLINAFHPSRPEWFSLSKRGQTPSLPWSEPKAWERCVPQFHPFAHWASSRAPCSAPGPGVIPGQPEGTRAAAGSWLCPAGRQHQGGPSSLSKGLQLSHPTAEEGAPPQGAEAEPPPPSLGQRQLWTISSLHYKDQKQHLQQEQVLCCPCSEGLSLQGLMWP